MGKTFGTGKQDEFKPSPIPFQAFPFLALGFAVTAT
jgi:hypothetical protein